MDHPVYTMDNDKQRNPLKICFQFMIKVNPTCMAKYPVFQDLQYNNS